VKIKIGEPFYARDVIAATNDAARPEIAAQAAAPSGALASSAQQALSATDPYELVTDHLKNTIAAMINELRS
jgi:hypothetical protein